uniref:Uncharacterized protein n=1 Tax=Cacopsylla melanoneura TaxID=428564 RepID=A0A8D8SU94_9HEMI
MLHASVLPVRLDTRITSHHSHTMSLYDSKHLQRSHLVHSTRVYDRDQRLSGVLVWVLLRSDTSDQTVAEKDLGRLHRGRHIHRAPLHRTRFLPRQVRLLCVSGSIYGRQIQPCV